MRTDVIIDRKQVYLPNVSTIGYYKIKAQFGDMIRTKDYIGRVIGRISYAPKLSTNDPDVRGWLVCLVFGSNFTFPMERWINPAEVLECFDPTKYGYKTNESALASFVAFMFGPELKQYKPADLRAWQNYGGGVSCSIEDYLKIKREREELVGHPVSHIG